MNEQRFENLEIKLMHLEESLAVLNSTCVQQQLDLTAMREQLRMLTQRLAAYEEPQGASATAHEPPPHY